MKILFVDAKSSVPYDGDHLFLGGVSGTESTLVRIAEGCASYHQVAVAQLGRQQEVEVRNVRYVPLAAAPFLGGVPDRVVVLRKHWLTLSYRKKFPRARVFSWIHNWQRPEVALQRVRLARAQAGVIAVSEALRASADAKINGIVARMVGLTALRPQRVPTWRIYNPIDEDLWPDRTPVNPNQLISLSPAYKGLEQVLKNFRAVRSAMPDLTLLVAGADANDLHRHYPSWAPLLDQPGVRVLGRLPQYEMLNYVRQSFCVFYPQSVYPETFGLIFAEANAVGTPVLAHDFGSAREILGGNEQLVNAADGRGVTAKLASWRQGGRPQVGARPEFRLSAVVQAWLRLLEQ